MEFRKYLSFKNPEFRRTIVTQNFRIFKYSSFKTQNFKFQISGILMLQNPKVSKCWSSKLLKLQISKNLTTFYKIARIVKPFQNLKEFQRSKYTWTLNYSNKSIKRVKYSIRFTDRSRLKISILLESFLEIFCFHFSFWKTARSENRIK